ncbi:MAG: hypothetical protein AAFX99_21770, partial [Myxococcota bacterium]
MADPRAARCLWWWAVAVAVCTLCMGAPVVAQEPTGPGGEFPLAEDGPLPIEIYSDQLYGGERLLDPIAIPDAKTLNAVAKQHRTIGQEITDVLRFDLTLSGLYRVLDESSFFFDYAGEGLAADTINFDNWSGVGAKALIKSGYTVSKGKGGEVRVGLDIRFFFVDQDDKAVELEWKPREVAATEVRDTVHDFVNALVKHFKGSWGPFGTRLVVTARAKGGQKHIYTMDMDGFEVKRHT